MQLSTIKSLAVLFKYTIVQYKVNYCTVSIVHLYNIKCTAVQYTKVHSPCVYSLLQCPTCPALSLGRSVLLILSSAQGDTEDRPDSKPRPDTWLPAFSLVVTPLPPCRPPGRLPPDAEWQVVMAVYERMGGQDPRHSLRSRLFSNLKGQFVITRRGLLELLM